jgi:hypothetical protein
VDWFDNGLFLSGGGSEPVQAALNGGFAQPAELDLDVEVRIDLVGAARINLLNALRGR